MRGDEGGRLRLRRLRCRCILVNGGPPLGIGRILRQAPIVVRGVIVPPDRASLSEFMLGAIDRGVGRRFGSVVARSPGQAYGSAGIHQGIDPSLPHLGWQMRVRSAPQAASHHDVSSVRRAGNWFAALRHGSRGTWRRKRGFLSVDLDAPEVVTRPVRSHRDHTTLERQPWPGLFLAKSPVAELNRHEA